MPKAKLQALHYSHPLPQDPTQLFTLSCAPKTDIWNKPPSSHSFNAPILHHNLRHISQFKSASVAISAQWKERYDQGGLVLIIDPNNTSATKQTWLKTGIEFLNRTAHVSTVATREWSDWSLRPLPHQKETQPSDTVHSGLSTSASASASLSATVKIVHEDDGSLWVYVLEQDGMWSPIREVTWWADLDEKLECWVGVYAARPADTGSELAVEFQGFEIDFQGKEG